MRSPERKDAYMYQLTQFYFYNQCRKAICQIFKSDNTFCSIDIFSTIHEYFSNLFSTNNDPTRTEYPQQISEASRTKLNDTLTKQSAKT